MNTLKVNARTYTAKEIKESAIRDGQHATKYYPPSLWGTDDGYPATNDPPKAYGPFDEIYREGYLIGRADGLPLS